MHSSRNNKSTIINIIHSTGFLPLVFVIVSVTLWAMFINSLHDKASLKDTPYISKNTAADFSGKKYFEQQNIITRPEPNSQDLQALTMQLMKKYQDLELIEDKKYLDSLVADTHFSSRGTNTSMVMKNTELNKMNLRSGLNNQNPLQNNVNKLFFDSQDTIDTDYMNNLNIDSVTSVINKG